MKIVLMFSLVHICLPVFYILTVWKSRFYSQFMMQEIQLLPVDFPVNPRPGEPTDHPHHLGLWFTYENVNGLDFWNNSYAIPSEKKSLYGWIKTDSILEISSGPNRRTVLSCKLGKPAKSGSARRNNTICIFRPQWRKE